MNTRPEELEDDDVRNALTDGWGITTTAVAYAPVGFGSHHWDVTDTAGRRWFTTVNDLSRTGWVGLDPADAYIGLTQAFTIARALREDVGLQFVCAPVSGMQDEVIRPFGDHFTISVFPYVEGASHPHDDFASDDERDEVLVLLAELHANSSAVEHLARSETFVLPHRDDLELALKELGVEWEGGPFSEATRALIAPNADHIRFALAAYDDFVRAALSSRTPPVITHGEPHAANVMVTAHGPLLIDWDTCRLAPPERDLARVVADDASQASAYEEASGRTIDHDRLLLYCLWWDLAEIAGYTATFRQPHQGTGDVAMAWRNLQHFARLGEHYPGLLD